MQTELTEREWEIVEAILAANVTRSELAAALFIGSGTVDNHLKNIYSKTGARNLAELVLMACGLVWCAIPLPSGKTEGDHAT